MPRAWMWSTTAFRPPEKRPGASRHSPTVDHQSPIAGSANQPASMQKHSAPASAAASTSGLRASVDGWPMRVFMKSL